MECDLCGRATSERFPLPGFGSLSWVPWVCSFCLHIDWYRRMGFSFFPLKPKSKEPALASWKVYQERRPTDDEIAGWMNGIFGNVAVVCGPVSGNLIVLDFDNEETYHKAFRDFEGLQKATFVVRTSRGFHVYLRSINDPGRTEKYEGLGFEYRAEGSYVAAPPSIHPSGAVYTRVGEWQVLEVEDGQEAKKLVLNKLGYEPPKTWNTKPPTDRAPLKYTPPCIQRLKGVAEGFRNEAAMRITCFLLREIELEEGEVWKRLLWWNSFNKPPLDERELRSVFKSALKGGYRYGCNSMKEYCIPGLCRIAYAKERGVKCSPTHL